MHLQGTPSLKDKGKGATGLKSLSRNSAVPLGGGGVQGQGKGQRLIGHIYITRPRPRPVSVTQCRLQHNMLLLTGGTAASILPEHDVSAPCDGDCAGAESRRLPGVAEHRAPLV